MANSTKFRADHYSKFLESNRKWMLRISVSLALLGIFDTLTNLNASRQEMIATWFVALSAPHSFCDCKLLALPDFVSCSWMLT